MKKNSKTRNKREAKKALVMEENRNWTKPLIISCLLVAAVAAGAYFWGRSRPLDATMPAAVAAANKNLAETVTYPVSQFADGKAHHFEYQDGDIRIRYFLVKSTDGIIRAAFDACDVCWPAGKGYYQEGDTMVCRNCGRKFATNKVNEVKGGCNPAPLARKVDGASITLLTDDIRSGRMYFDFSKRTSS